MKKTTIYLTMALVLAGVFLFSCSKTFENENKTKDLNESTFKEYPSPPSPVTITCSGTCSDGNRCTFRVVGGNQYGECDCEGCTLIVHHDGGKMNTEEQSEVLKKMFNQEMFIPQLQEFVVTKFKTNEFGILSIEYAVYDKSYYILYDIITETGLRESVMYVSVVPIDSKEPSVKYEIDCSGSCDEPGESCRERYVFNPPSAECTCESDNCTMTINEL